MEDSPRPRDEHDSSAGFVWTMIGFGALGVAAVVGVLVVYLPQFFELAGH